MTTGYVQPGEVLELTAPSGGVTSGTGYQIGRIFVVALTSALVGVKFNASMTGVHSLAKIAAEPWTEGLLIYYNTGALKCTSVSTTSMLIGVATRTEANPTSTGYVRLNGVGQYFNQP